MRRRDFLQVAIAGGVGVLGLVVVLGVYANPAARIG